MDNQQIIEMIKIHGKKDFYEQATGKLYRLSEMKYHLFYNKTIIPVVNYNAKCVSVNEQIELEGNYETMA